MDNLDKLLKSWMQFRETLSKDAADPKLAPKDRKVKELRDKIDAGTYKPDAGKIADKMIDRGVVKEEASFNKAGQWSMTKSGYGPKRGGQYSPTDNIKRKQTRTAEERDTVGPNVGVRQYTTTGSSLSDARAKKLIAQNKKQPVKTMKDMSPEELQEIKDRYSVKKFSTGAPITASGAPVGGVAMTDKNKR
jgi:hypothetical protein